MTEVDHLAVRPRSENLDRFVNILVKELRDELVLDELRNEPPIRAYRDFYWRVGLDPTKVRPASEAILRRLAQGKSFPQINTVVDAYNLASAKTRVAIAAFDADRVRGGFRMRLARAEEAFLGIGMDRPSVLRGVEVVVQDDEQLVAIYPYRDADASKLTSGTSAAHFMICGVPGIPREKLTEAEATTREFVERFGR